MLRIEGPIQDRLNAGLAGLIPPALLVAAILYGVVSALEFTGNNYSNFRFATLTHLNLITSLICLVAVFWFKKNPIKPALSHFVASVFFLLVLINTLLRIYWFNGEALGITFYLLVTAFLINSVGWFIFIEGSAVILSLLIAFYSGEDGSVRTEIMPYILIGAINGLLIFTLRYLSAIKAEKAHLQLEHSNKQLATLIKEKEILADSLAESERRSRSLLNIAPVSIIVHYLGTILWVNPEAKKMLGLDSDENMIGTSLFDYLDADTANKMEEVVRARASEKVTLYTEIHSVLHKSGQKIRVETTSLPLKFEGDLARVVFAKDITHQLEYEDTLKNARDEALVANQEKSRFLSSMSHELRTPLNAILGFSELMLMDKEDTLDQKKKRDYLQIISKSGNHLLSLISDLLEIGSVDSGSLQLELEDHVLRELINECKVMEDQSLAEKNINLDIHVDYNILIHADRIRVRQVFINLINNAIKFSPENGKIIIAAKPVKQGLIEISIADSGPGISKADHERIFSEFYRAPQDHQGDEKSTGIGLAVCKRMVEYHGGKIWVDSETRKNTRIVFTLPEGADNLRDESRQNNLIVDSGTDAVPKSRILVVEDNQTNMRLVREILLRVGHEAIEAVNGEIAVLLASEHLPDLILMDLEMPIMNGYEATRIICQNPQTRHIPIIALTAHADKKTMDACHEAGCTETLSKPIDLMELYSLMDRLLSKESSILDQSA